MRICRSCPGTYTQFGPPGVYYASLAVPLTATPLPLEHHRTALTNLRIRADSLMTTDDIGGRIGYGEKFFGGAFYRASGTVEVNRGLGKLGALEFRTELWEYRRD